MDRRSAKPGHLKTAHPARVGASVAATNGNAAIASAKKISLTHLATKAGRATRRKAKTARGTRVASRRGITRKSKTAALSSSLDP